MSQKHKLSFTTIIFLGLIAELILLGALASAVQAFEMASAENTDLGSVVLRERSMNLVAVAPVTSDGEALGAIAIYDDPSTNRTEDYLEMYDSDGVRLAGMTGSAFSGLPWIAHSSRVRTDFNAPS